MEFGTCLFLNTCDVKLLKKLLVRKQMEKTNMKDQPHRCVPVTKMKN